MEAPVELSPVDGEVAVLLGAEEFSSSEVVASDVDDVVGFAVEVLSDGLFDWLLQAARTHNIRQQHSTIAISFFKTKITSGTLIQLL